MLRSAPATSRIYWFLAGMRGLFSVPSVILSVSFIGFSAFALQSGVSRSEAMLMTVLIWALPAKMILIGSAVSGANLFAIGLAVCLSSVRLMPMVASLVPDMRHARTPVWLLLLLSHFVAITAWVFATGRLKQVPTAMRISYFAGFGVTLVCFNTLLVGLSYGLVSTFPPLIAALLFFLTPIYFVTSIWATAEQSVVKLAFVVGAVTGPLLALIVPEFDILIAGIGGGALSYLLDRFFLRSRKTRRQELRDAISDGQGEL